MNTSKYTSQLFAPVLLFSFLILWSGCAGTNNTENTSENEQENRLTQSEIRQERQAIIDRFNAYRQAWLAGDISRIQELAVTRGGRVPDRNELEVWYQNNQQRIERFFRNGNILRDRKFFIQRREVPGIQMEGTLWFQGGNGNLAPQLYYKKSDGKWYRILETISPETRDPNSGENGENS